MSRVSGDNGCSLNNILDRIDNLLDRINFKNPSTKSENQRFDKINDVQFLHGPTRRQSPVNNGQPPLPVSFKKTENPEYQVRSKDDIKTQKVDINTLQNVNLPDVGKVHVVNEPIIVDGGVFDGKGATFTASSLLGTGGQDENQRPIFILKNGAELRNVTLGENGADGIHVYNGATLTNVHWLNVGEDALTVKTKGDIFINGGSATGATDKIFQVNADTNFYLSDFSADDFTTLFRTNGGKQIEANLIIDGGFFANGVNLFRTDSSSANVQFLSDISIENVKNRIRVGNDVIEV